MNVIRTSNPYLFCTGNSFTASRIARLAVRYHSKMRILCVAEKPSIAKAVAGHLSGGHSQSVGIATSVYRKRKSYFADGFASAIRQINTLRTIPLIMTSVKAGAIAV